MSFLPMSDHPHKAERKTDRIVKLKVKDGTKPKSSTGNFDTRLFQGTNTLHIKKNLTNNLWYFEYEMGGLQSPLKQKFTSFDKALHHAKKYFENRNVEIVEIID